MPRGGGFPQIPTIQINLVQPPQPSMKHTHALRFDNTKVVAGVVHNTPSAVHTRLIATTTNGDRYKIYAEELGRGEGAACTRPKGARPDSTEQRHTTPPPSLPPSPVPRLQNMPWSRRRALHRRQGRYRPRLGDPKRDDAPPACQATATAVTAAAALLRHPLPPAPNPRGESCQ